MGRRMVCGGLQEGCWLRRACSPPPWWGRGWGRGGECRGIGVPPSPQPLSRGGRGAEIRALRVWFLGRGGENQGLASPPLPNPSPAGGEGLWARRSVDGCPRWGACRLAAWGLGSAVGWGQGLL